jgi:hypothetical protein
MPRTYLKRCLRTTGIKSTAYPREDVVRPLYTFESTSIPHCYTPISILCSSLPLPSAGKSRSNCLDCVPHDVAGRSSCHNLIPSQAPHPETLSRRTKTALSFTGHPRARVFTPTALYHAIHQLTLLPPEFLTLLVSVSFAVR